MLQQYELMTWFEFMEARDRDDLFILPIGAVEQHGPHLPMGFDLFSVYELAKQKIADRYNAVILPPLYYGYRSQTTIGGGDSYAGTIRMSGEAVCFTIRDIVMEMFRHGVKHFMILNGHLENKIFITEGIEKAFAEYKGEINTKVLSMEWACYVKNETLDAIFDGNFPGWDPEHAGVLETSFMLALDPSIVRMDCLPDESAERYIKYSVWPSRPEFVTKNGALCPAKRSSIANGELMMKDVLDGIFADLDYEYAQK